jgi:hypothetical protein
VPWPISSRLRLDSRSLIERAEGALMERERLDEQEAFTRLRRAARSSGRKLSQVAGEGRRRPAPAQVADPAGEGQAGAARW